ncbi:hypothetical protein B5X24_HaOG208931 [Helicoverpa armigera]|uniref:Uncharacterized protein n=1 Tax=Helicoverpa armigera TaxID=29058 RepID=A0A2W1BKE2_HELAM|nr:hypothetical protein B5X24_HaOG208931 [Helicoverpa armigera]
MKRMNLHEFREEQNTYNILTGNSKICSEEIMADKRQKQSGTKSASIADGSWIRLSGKRCLTSIWLDGTRGIRAPEPWPLQTPSSDPKWRDSSRPNSKNPSISIYLYSIAMTTHSLECSTTEQSKLLPVINHSLSNTTNRSLRPNASDR